MKRRADEGNAREQDDHPSKATDRRHRPQYGVALVAVALVALLAGAAYVGPVALVDATTTAPAAPAAVDNVSVATTSSFAFVPDTLTVYPGALVHLVVTQESPLAHTFVLSPVANQTIPTSDTSAEVYAYFNANPPLVNLSVPGVVGDRAYANFTAPAIGSYEFVCEIPGHFQSGMHGELVSTTQTGGSTGMSFPLELTVLVVALVIVVAAVAGVLLLRRRRARSPPGGPGSPS